jgi:hypothetical protein
VTPEFDVKSMSILIRDSGQCVLLQLMHAATNLMALVARRIMAVPEDVAADRTRVLKPLLIAQGGRNPDVTAVTPGAVVATTVVPAGSAPASTRMNALYKTLLDVGL